MELLVLNESLKKSVSKGKDSSSRDFENFDDTLASAWVFQLMNVIRLSKSPGWARLNHNRHSTAPKTFASRRVRTNTCIYTEEQSISHKECISIAQMFLHLYDSSWLTWWNQFITTRNVWTTRSAILWSFLHDSRINPDHSNATQVEKARGSLVNLYANVVSGLEIWQKSTNVPRSGN